MAIIGLGTDIIEIGRIQYSVDGTFLRRYFTENEKTMFASNNMRPNIVAANFCVKEAVVKALGTGFRDGIQPQDIETLRNSEGKPVVTLYSSAKEKAEELGVTHIHVTISHTKQYATATVIMEG